MKEIETRITTLLILKVSSKKKKKLSLAFVLKHMSKNTSNKNSFHFLLTSIIYQNIDFIIIKTKDYCKITSKARNFLIFNTTI